MTIKFRYYFEKDLTERLKKSTLEWDKKLLKRHYEIISLLQKIKENFGIDYELFEYSKKDKKRIYKEHFTSRARFLSKVLDECVSRALRSQSGRGHIYIHGVIAIVENGQIIWFNKGYWRDYDIWKSYDSDEPMTIGFLKCVIDNFEYLKKILKEINYAKIKERSIHDEIIEQFVSSIKIGTIEREVEVGNGLVMIDKYGTPKVTGRYRIDIVWKTGNETYVIEVKEKLNFEAIGQAIVYKELYKKEHPNENVKSGIVCKVADKEILEIAQKYVDKIWYYNTIEKGTISWTKLSKY